ncbi:MAG TPA: SEC-C metal-binding domain-containing protein [Thermoanaerobaculia bacterium]|nr:SEC-C metal-binding domain-containing protein [Thermoanaerobaculia bacterium]
MTQLDPLTPIKAHLRKYRDRLSSDFTAIDEEVAAQLEQVRLDAVAAGDQALAKETWCLKTALEMQQKFVAAFLDMKAGRFYDAWCTLERIEIAALGLARHMKLDDEYALAFIDEHVERFQKLYPYAIFMSPAYVEKEVRCSICDSKISIRSGCEHRVGEIYDGIKCLRIVTMAEMLEMSFVPTPVQKYSVPFLKDAKTGKQVDHYDYSLVRYVVRGLRSPFDGWTMHRTTARHPHRLYNHVGRNDKCPCDSGKKYKKCCLSEAGVLRPHIDIDFDVPPPEDLPAVEFSRNR